MTGSDNTISADDRDWLALRYVLGELSCDDAAAFEAVLADDQTSRDAVVQATRLVQALAAVPTPVARSAQPSRIGRWVAALTATAAIVLIAVVTYRGGARQEAQPGLAAHEIDPARLFVLWSASGDTLGGSSEMDVAEEVNGDFQAGLLPPDWLLAAVEYDLSSPAEPEGEFGSDAIERN